MYLQRNTVFSPEWHQTIFFLFLSLVVYNDILRIIWRYLDKHTHKNNYSMNSFVRHSIGP